MSLNTIMVVRVNHRTEKAVDIQNIFTKYGCSIKVRIGLHEAGDVCSDDGLIILQLIGSMDEIKSFNNELNSVEGIKANIMEI